MMYDGEPTHVTLRCDNAIMKAIIDRFGESVKTLLKHHDISEYITKELQLGGDRR